MSRSKLDHALDAARRDPLDVPLRDKVGRVVAHAILDPADAGLSDLRWCRRPDGYAVRMEQGRIVRLHRAVVSAKPGETVDHINGDRLDCRRSNLRVCSIAENAQNLAPRPGGSSRFRGVRWHKATQKWAARVKLNYEERHLGVFTSEVVAGAVAAAFREQHMPFSEEAR